jgi:hypothetical protein
MDRRSVRVRRLRAEMMPMGDADGQPDQGGAEGELNCDQDSIEELVLDRRAGRVGEAEARPAIVITQEHMANEQDVLLQHRFVEAELVADLLDLLGGRVSAGEGDRRVGGGHHEEHDVGDAGHDQQHDHDHSNRRTM